MKYAIGVDIGGTSIKVGLVSEEGKIIDRLSYDSKVIKSQEDIITELSNQIVGLINKNGKDVVGIGIGCAGAIDTNKGECEYSNNLNWHHLPICEIMTSIIKKPSVIANDANVAALGEARYGSAKKYKHSILITLGTGVGGGLVLNGKLYEGVDGKGAEIGHMSIDKFNGRPCNCGDKGCLETYTSATALIKDADLAIQEHPESLIAKMKKDNNGKLTAKMVFDAKEQKDTICIQLVNNYISYLAEGILNLINIFRPEVVLLSGGISNQGEKLTDPINKILKEKHYGFGTVDNKEVKVLIASLGADTGILGAAALAFDKIN